MATNGCKHEKEGYEYWPQALSMKAGIEVMTKGQTNNYGDRVTVTIGKKTITVVYCGRCKLWY